MRTDDPSSARDRGRHVRPRIFGVLGAVVAGMLLAGCASGEPAPAPSVNASATAIAIESPTPTATRRPAVSPTPPPSASPAAASAAPLPSPSPDPGASPENVPSPLPLSPSPSAPASTAPIAAAVSAAPGASASTSPGPRPTSLRPTATPDATAAPTRVPARTAAPSPVTPSASPAPTAAPTVPAPTAPATAAPTLAPLGGLGADLLAFDDTFVSSGPWTLPSGANGRATVEEGALRLTVSERATTIVASRSVGDPAVVVRAEASLTMGAGDGEAGLVCSGPGAGLPEISGRIDAQGGWSVILRLDGATRVIGEGPLPPDHPFRGAGDVHLILECAGTGTADGDRVALWVDRILVADRLTGSSHGPWDRAGVLAASQTLPVGVVADDVRALVGSAYRATRLDPVVAELLAGAPEAWRRDCVPTGALSVPGALAGIACAPAAEAEQVEYYRFADGISLGGALDRLVADAGVRPPGRDCSAGPSDVAWSVAGEPTGRVVCFDRPAGGGRVIAWTDPGSLLLAVGTIAGGGYPELYDWWLGAGPGA